MKDFDGIDKAPAEAVATAAVVEVVDAPANETPRVEAPVGDAPVVEARVAINDDALATLEK